MAMSRSFCLVSVFTTTVITIFYDLVNYYDGTGRASSVMDVYRQMACFGGGHLLDNLTKHRTAIELTLGVLVLWVLMRQWTAAFFSRINWVRTNTLCRASGRRGIFIGIVYSLDSPLHSQAIVISAPSAPDMQTRNSLALWPITAGLTTPIVRQLFLGSHGLLGFFSVNGLVSAYQWTYYTIAALLDPDAFDMSAYLATPIINLHSLLGPSSADSTVDISLGSLAIYDLLSAYCYAIYPIRRLLSPVLGLDCLGGPSTEAALALHHPNLLITSRTSPALRISTSVFHWLNTRKYGREDVTFAPIEELEREKVKLAIVYGLQLVLSSTTPELSFGAFSTQDLLAAFVYTYNPVQGRTIAPRFACTTLRVVHRNKCADINVQIFNVRTCTRLLTLLEDPPESFRDPRAFARIASDATTTTDVSSVDTDSAFPYTDGSDFDFDALHLGLGSATDSDGSACDDSDSDVGEMTWMLDELSVDDYPSLYGWDLEELVRALQALTIDDLRDLCDSELEDLLALLKMVSPLGQYSSDAGVEPRFLADVGHLLEVVKAHASGLPESGEGEGEATTSLRIALARLLADNIEASLALLGFESAKQDGLKPQGPPISHRCCVLRELLARLRSRRHEADTSDLLSTSLRIGDKCISASPWKGKGKALDFDLDSEVSSRSPGLPTLPRTRTRRGRYAADSDASSDDAMPRSEAQKKKKRHRGGKRIPMAERRRRARRTFQETLAPLREVEFVEGPSWAPDDEKWCEGFGMW